MVSKKMFGQLEELASRGWGPVIRCLRESEGLKCYGLARRLLPDNSPTICQIQSYATYLGRIQAGLDDPSPLVLLGLNQQFGISQSQLLRLDHHAYFYERRGARLAKRAVQLRKLMAP